MRQGLLLINLGTPKSASISAVKNYLRAFLTDKRVITLPALFRYILVYFFILPLRAKRSAHAYKTIWTEQGSPLLYYSNKLTAALQKEAGPDYMVSLGMRYGEPSISQALDTLKSCDSITILPLYPHYSSAATGSAIEQALSVISSWSRIPSLRIIRDFFQHPSYIKAQAALIKNYLQEQEYLLFSYHGIPERQIECNECLSVCTSTSQVTRNNQSCYKAVCYQSSRLLAQELHLLENQYSTAFQSRLGKTPWIKPYLEKQLGILAAQGIKKLVIACPSFVADCLETLEEIGVRARHQWLALGGEQLIVVPCLNTDPLWIKALMELVEVSGST
jgi:ferrochelatase